MSPLLSCIFTAHKHPGHRRVLGGCLGPPQAQSGGILEEGNVGLSVVQGMKRRLTSDRGLGGPWCDGQMLWKSGKRDRKGFRGKARMWSRRVS